MYVTVSQAARRYGIHEETLFRAINQGRLVALTNQPEEGVQRSILIPESDLRVWIEANRNRLAITNPRRRKLKKAVEAAR